jgi:transposase-like protein
MIMRSSAPSETFIRLFDDVATNGHADVPPVFGPCGTIPTGEQVLSIEEVARRFSVSTKTISRWRDHGLVAQRYTTDGRRRVGFLTSAVERFLIEDLDLNRKRRANVVDRTAAAWILQGALDRLRP